MSENPVDDFLEKVSTPRKPLTEKERKEAMEVASQIRKKAEGIAGGKDEVFVVHVDEENPDRWQGILIYSGKEVRKYNHRYPDTDLIIKVFSLREDEGGEGISLFEDYYFGRDEVLKVTTDQGISDAEKERRVFNEDGGLEENGQIAELGTQETYNPDKVDLSDLLANLSSAEIV